MAGPQPLAPRRPGAAAASRAWVRVSLAACVADRPLLAVEAVARQADPRPLHASHARRGDGRVRRRPHPADPPDWSGTCGLHADRYRSQRRERCPRYRSSGDLDSVGETVREAGTGSSPSAEPLAGPDAGCTALAWDVESMTNTRPDGDGGPRLTFAPVDGLPLLRLTQPTVPRCLTGAEEHRRPRRRSAPAARLVPPPSRNRAWWSGVLPADPSGPPRREVVQDDQVWLMVRRCGSAQRPVSEDQLEELGLLFKLRHDPRCHEARSDAAPVLTRRSVGTFTPVSMRLPFLFVAKRS